MTPLSDTCAPTVGVVVISPDIVKYNGDGLFDNFTCNIKFNEIAGVVVNGVPTTPMPYTSHTHTHTVHPTLYMC